MDWMESGKMAVKTLTANKMRSMLTMLGIIIGNSSVIAMVGIGQGAQKLASDQFKSLGPNLVVVVPGANAAQTRASDPPKTLVLEDAQAIAEQVPAVTAVAPQRQNQFAIVRDGLTSTSSVIGTTPDFLSVRSFDVAKGRFITQSDLEADNLVVTLGSEMATRFFGNRDPIGEQIRIKGVSFQVVGVLKEKGAFLGSNQDDTAYVPLTTMVNRLTGRTSPYGLDVSVIYASAKNENNVSAAQYQITNLLRLRHQITTDDDFTVQTQKDILNIVGTITGGLTIMLAAIAAISLLVGGIGIMNIMLVSVTERTKEIGLRKAIGASGQDILTQFIIEALMLSAAGGAIGTVVGIGGVTLVAALTPLQAGIAPAAIVAAVGVSGGIGLFFGVVPARRAAQLDPIVALRES